MVTCGLWAVHVSLARAVDQTSQILLRSLGLVEGGRLQVGQFDDSCMT